MFKNLTYRIVTGGAIGVVVLFILASAFAPFFYHKDTFAATITEIEYNSRGGLFGGSDATLKFDDGRVYNLNAARVPAGLRIGQAYTLEYRTPYFLSSPYMTIKEKKVK